MKCKQCGNVVKSDEAFGDKNEYCSEVCMNKDTHNRLEKFFKENPTDKNNKLFSFLKPVMDKQARINGGDSDES